MPGTIRILAVAGSLGARSSNLALVMRARELAPDGVDVSVLDGLGRLPFFDPEITDPPETVLALRTAIATSDAVLVACPEYGHSLPGVLKNAIDWVIGSGELERKVVAITASVVHRDRGRMGLAALRQTLGAVSAQIVGGEPIVRGPDADHDVRAPLDAIVATVRSRD